MALSDQRVLAVLRRMIFDGSLKPGEKITEVRISETLGVSRTPVRIALKALEVEGLIEKLAGRGYTVQPVEIGDVREALEVRGVLESLAARRLAEDGMSDGTAAILERSVAATARLVALQDITEGIIEAYQDANAVFHTTIMERCSNRYVARMYERIRHLPMLNLGALAFNRDALGNQDLLRLTVGHTQHAIILDALKKREGARAGAMMEEHSNATVTYAAIFAGDGAPTDLGDMMLRSLAANGGAAIEV